MSRRKTLKQMIAVRRGAPDTIDPIPLWLVYWILNWPRLVRIGGVTLLTLGFTTAVFPLVDSIYIQYFFDEATIIVPSVASAGIGALFYGIGWWLVIGIRGDEVPARLAVLWYVGIGLLTSVLALVLVILGYFIGIAPT